MSNDLTTLSGALLEMKDELIYQLGQKGVTASYSSTDGLLGLIGRIADIQQGGGGSCYKVTFDNASYTTTGSVTVSVTVLKNYSACVGETVTFTSSTSTTTTATTDSNGVATATINFSASTTLTASIGGATDTATVTISSIIWEDDFNRSTLGSDWVTFGSGANVSISNNQLVLSRTGNGRGGIYYNTPVTGDYKITLDFASGDYDNVNLGIAQSGTSWTCYEVEPKWYFGFITIASNGTISSSVHEQRTSNVSYGNNTIITVEVVQDTSISFYVNGTLKATYNVQDRTTDGYVGVTQCCGRTSKYNSIKVEPL